MSNPFRYSKRKRTLNRPKYDEEPPPITKSIFLNNYLPVALLNSWVTCDTLGCHNVPSCNFGPFTESGEYTTGVSSSAESKILVQIPPKEFHFNSNGDFYIDTDAGPRSKISVHVDTGGGGCDYEHVDYICTEREFVLTENKCLSAGSTVTFSNSPDNCPYVRSDLQSDNPVFTFLHDLALAAGSTITFTGGAVTHIPIPVPIIGLMHILSLDSCPLDYYAFRQFRFIPSEIQTIEVANAESSYPAYMVLIEVFLDMIAFRFYRNDCDVNPIVIQKSDGVQFALYGVVEHHEMPDLLYICVLGVASNDRTFIHSSIALRKEDNLPETFLFLPAAGYQLVYNPPE